MITPPRACSMELADISFKNWTHFTKEVDCVFGFMREQEQAAFLSLIMKPRETNAEYVKKIET